MSSEIAENGGLAWVIPIACETFTVETTPLPPLNARDSAASGQKEMKPAPTPWGVMVVMRHKSEVDIAMAVSLGDYQH